VDRVRRARVLKVKSLMVVVILGAEKPRRAEITPNINSREYMVGSPRVNAEGRSPADGWGVAPTTGDIFVASARFS
jgi:hypothetical protein